MKTKFFFGVAAMVLLASCESVIEQDLEVTMGGEASDMTVTAVIESKAGTRTALSGEANSSGYHSLYWEKGDAISISDGESTAVFTTESDGTPTGVFTTERGTY